MNQFLMDRHHHVHVSLKVPAAGNLRSTSFRIKTSKKSKLLKEFEARQKRKWLRNVDKPENSSRCVRRSERIFTWVHSGRKKNGVLLWRHQMVKWRHSHGEKWNFELYPNQTLECRLWSFMVYYITYLNVIGPVGVLVDDHCGQFWVLVGGDVPDVLVQHFVSTPRIYSGYQVVLAELEVLLHLGHTYQQVVRCVQVVVVIQLKTCAVRHNNTWNITISHYTRIFIVKQWVLTWLRHATGNSIQRRHMLSRRIFQVASKFR